MDLETKKKPNQSSRFSAEESENILKLLDFEEEFKQRNQNQNLPISLDLNLNQNEKFLEQQAQTKQQINEAFPNESERNQFDQKFIRQQTLKNHMESKRQMKEWAQREKETQDERRYKEQIRKKEKCERRLGQIGLFIFASLYLYLYWIKK